jgi:hypothetical protein
VVKVTVKAREPEGYMIELVCIRTSVRDGMYCMIGEDENLMLPISNIAEITEARQ